MSKLLKAPLQEVSAPLKWHLNPGDFPDYGFTQKTLEELAISVTFSEDLNRIPPKKSVKIRARVKKIKKGLPSII